MKRNRFIIITGMSGAGKSVAIKCFEDLDFFCVDNLPSQLIPKFSEMVLKSQGKLSKIAIVVDIRGEIFFRELDQSLKELENMNIHRDILFLEARDDVIVRRFSETRRKHPLQFSQNILESISHEREKLKELKSKASIIIDTSNLDSRQLCFEIKRVFLREKKDDFHVSVISFGYKYGMPIDVDLIFDARFLPNPYYQNELSELSGKDERIKEYLLQFPVTRQFVKSFFSLINSLIPFYKKEGKSFLSIAIGCTGGRHRSVFLANELAHFLKNKHHHVLIKHRDIMKEEKISKEKS
ncbi:MAG: RNase adapter RapZ [Candidatus Atribacteria bacterium]|nr:RNase adapter RapZ [Candidatus Atribacteria bacterium]